MADAVNVAFRFRRSEMTEKVGLSEQGLAVLDRAPQPLGFVQTLIGQGLEDDAVRALAMMLPHRQAVWWACLAVRLTPGLDKRKDECTALEVAERWVQGSSPSDAQWAGELADKGDPARAATWAAQAAHWAGPSLAPRGQQAVAPAPFLPGVATRGALQLLCQDPGFGRPLELAEWLPIGLALMRGENGQKAQAETRDRLSKA